ncbi:hypothetical protein ACHAPT_013302 [Fusarium lateritium]
MVLASAAKATALLLTLPSVTHGMPVPPPPADQPTVNLTFPFKEAMATIPGIEYILGPDLPHIENPSFVIGPPNPKWLNETLVAEKSTSWMMSMLRHLGMIEDDDSTKSAVVNKNKTTTTVNGTQPTSNGTQPTVNGKKHSKRFLWAILSEPRKYWSTWTDVVEHVTPDSEAEWDNRAETTIVNSTPYRWRKGYTHAYQMTNWNKNWPNYIEPGQAARVSTSTGQYNAWDAAGEVVYHLEGVSEPASFMVSRKKPKDGDHIFKWDMPNEIWVTFKENLKTLNSPKKTARKLKWWDWPGGTQWILAGKEGNFIADDAGPAWMSERIDQIGHIPLRELSMPRSHHAGMYRMTEDAGMGTIYNSLTQYRDLKYQLTEGGVRVIDVRPFFIHDKKHGYRAFEAHGAVVGASWHGVVGAPLREMIDQVNEFNKKHPGELIIWDIHPAQALVKNHLSGEVEQMSEGHRAMLYEEFKRLKHRIEVPDHGDLTMWPLEKFVGNGTSAVLIRTHREWIKDESWPGGAKGFITTDSFPVHQVWTDSQDVTQLTERMLPEMTRMKRKRNSKIFFADWVINQKGFDVVASKTPITDLAVMAYKAMYYEFWEALTTDTYPNWIATDGIYSSELKSFAMAINHCLAAKMCGKMVPSRKFRLQGDGFAQWEPKLDWVDDKKEGG